MACRVLKVNRKVYYQWLKATISQRYWDDAHAINALRELRFDDPPLGYRSLTDELGNVGITASENRACGCARWLGCLPHTTASVASPGTPVHDDLLAVVDEWGNPGMTSPPRCQTRSGSLT